MMRGWKQTNVVVRSAGVCRHRPEAHATRDQAAFVRLAALMAVALMPTAVTRPAAAADPWADQVVSYSPGATADPNYSATPGVVIGAPERFTGENTPFGPFPGAVTMFNPAFGLDEIISIGEGGQLTVRFDEPITDDPAHLYGIDLLVFGNSFFAADFSNFPDASHLGTAALFDSDSAVIELSADGVNFLPVSTLADRLFPTEGYLDTLAFDGAPGLLPTDFTRPVNPALSLSDFDGLTHAQARALYSGSGGGAPVDLAEVGLTSVSHVRIRVPDDGNAATHLKAEIDAFATVPEPGTLALFGLAAFRWRCGRRRKTQRH